MGGLCSKRAAPPVANDGCLSAGPQNDNKHIGLSKDIIASGLLEENSSSSKLIGITVAWACADSLCSTLDSVFTGIVESLDQHLADNAAITWLAGPLPMRAIINSSISQSAATHSASKLLAVLYTLIVAAPAAVTRKMARCSPAVNRLVATLSILLSKQDIHDAAQLWFQWQHLTDAISLPLCYLPAVLTPASKAILLQLEAAARSKSVSTVKLQVLHCTLHNDQSDAFLI